jgi:hypothetical protein
MNDYPALFSLSGQKKGKNRLCSLFEWYNICVLERISEHSVYGNIRWLLRTHKYRKMADSFDGKIEKDSFAPQSATDRIVFEMCQKIKFKLGKKSKGDVDNNSKRGRKETETTENIDVSF